jgi:hypothetical protein
MAIVVIVLMWAGVILFWVGYRAPGRHWPIRQYGSQLQLGPSWRTRAIASLQPIGLALLGSFPLDMLVETRTWLGVVVMLGVYAWVGRGVYRRLARRPAIIDLAMDAIIDQGRMVGHPSAARAVEYDATVRGKGGAFFVLFRDGTRRWPIPPIETRDARDVAAMVAWHLERPLIAPAEEDWWKDHESADWR